MSAMLNDLAKAAGLDPERLLIDLMRAQQGESIPVHLGAMEGMLVVSALQLALSHPGFTGESRDIVEHFTRELGARVVNLAGPNVQRVIELGWRPRS